MKNRVNNPKSYNDFTGTRRFTSETFLFASIYFVAFLILIFVSSCNNKSDASADSNPSYSDTLNLLANQLHPSLTETKTKHI